MGDLRALLAQAAAVAMTMAVAACGNGADPPAAGRVEPNRTIGPRVSGEVRVLAASSLTEAFSAMAEAFEAEHPDVHVSLSFGASSGLAQQIDSGAAADVVVTADEATMQQVVDASNASAPAVIARNRLAILVEKGNPKAISNLRDLDAPGLVLVLCAPEVPCGRLAAAALRKAGVAATPASLEENVKAVVAKVALGEADAGIAYASDLVAARGTGAPVEGIDVGTDIDDDPRLQAAYPAAVATHTQNPRAARALVAFLRSKAGLKILTDSGLLAP